MAAVQDCSGTSAVQDCSGTSAVRSATGHQQSGLLWDVRSALGRQVCYGASAVKSALVRQQSGLQWDVSSQVWSGLPALPPPPSDMSFVDYCLLFNFGVLS